MSRFPVCCLAALLLLSLSGAAFAEENGAEPEQVKVFGSYVGDVLQSGQKKIEEQINEWLRKERPTITRVVAGGGSGHQSGHVMVLIFYKKTSD